jgi:hypothetical protein
MLTVDFCNRAAARYAVKRWHYSGRMPGAQLFTVGAWENGRFIGCVIFSLGASTKLGAPFRLGSGEIVELTRIALDEQHLSPVTQVMAEAVRLLKRTNPAMRLIVSFADPEHGHHGGIYQAGNWIYVGRGLVGPEWIIHGKRYHNRSVYSKGWRQSLSWLQQHIDPNAALVKPEPKFKYVLPLDRPMRRRMTKLAKPYPQPLSGSAGVAPGPAPG